MNVRPRHWSRSRLAQGLRRTARRGRDRVVPSLAPQALHFLDAWLRPSDTFVEFGSGRCTLWLAQRIGRLASFEDLPGWYDTVRGQLDAADANNVDYRLVTSDNLLQRADESLTAFPGRAPDGVLISGLESDCCAVWALLHLRPGGIVVIDKPGRYLPRRRRGPAAAADNGSTPAGLHDQFARGVADWRCVHWSEGGCDTAVFFKPCR